jgi:hypothetical protein
MCTLVVAFQQWGVPLLVAANRDEFLARPSLAPAWRTDGPIPVFAGRDVTAGGTWLGLNKAGVFAAITNRWPAASHDDRRSRGQLVLDALAHSSAEAAADAVGAYSGDQYNGFHLVMADRDRAELVWGDGQTLRRRQLVPGIHVVTERSLRPQVETDVVETPMGPVRPMPPTREIDLREEDVLNGPTEPTTEQLKVLMKRHAPEPFDGPCVHAGEFPYGTRSSSIVGLGATVTFHYADGPPCVTPWSDLSAVAQST